MDIKIAAGQRLMAGLPGTELDPGFVSLVRECKVGNVILFRRNVKSAAQLERLCTSLRRLIVAETGFEPFIAIDQEGGRRLALLAGHGHNAGGHGSRRRRRGRSLQGGPDNRPAAACRRREL